MRRYSSQSEAKAIAQFLIKQIVNRACGDGRTDWTDAVQESLADYMNKQGWEKAELLPPLKEGRPSRECRRDSFLLDFVIWRRDIEGKEGAWIACESEWDRNADSVIKDFEKLLSFRAPYKLMIYDVSNKPALSALCRSKFESYIHNFRWHLEDEIYIFLEFVQGEDVAHAYIWEPNEEASLTRIL